MRPRPGRIWSASPGDPIRTRIHPDAAASFRQAIADAGGIELFGICTLNDQRVVREIEVHCRGNEGAVPALLSRPRPGQAVIHNHPSGVLRASDADMSLASRYGEDGVGMLIVNNAVDGALWVVEPHVRERRRVSSADVERLLTVGLPTSMPGYEVRPGQAAMGEHVRRTLDDELIQVLEAGTGTGKSLAYLAPAALWALANESRVAVATYTIPLQAQLADSDLPVLKRAGLDLRVAVIKGRSNYLCRRKLAEALGDLETADADAPPTDAQALRSIDAWARTAEEGSRHDLAFPIEEDTWDRVASDHDQTLRARCPHYDRCFYYRARRKAADAHLIVANHHLMLADLAVKHEAGGQGILPQYDRLIIDEAHHLEDAATSLFRQQLTARAVRRAIAPLVARKRGRRPGALDHIAKRFAASGPLGDAEKKKIQRLCDTLNRELPVLRDEVVDWLEQLAADGLGGDQPSLRVTPTVRASQTWQVDLAPTLAELGARMGRVSGWLDQLDNVLRDLPPDARRDKPQPLFDIARARRKLEEQSNFASGFGKAGEDRVDWLGLARDKRRKAPIAALFATPVEVGETLRERVFDAVRAAVLTSATLTVRGDFSHFLGRVGLAPPPSAPPPPQGPDDLPVFHDESLLAPVVHSARFPSPFNYERQGLLALPSDLPAPDAPGYIDAVAAVTLDAIRASDGGVFVLCTSYRMVNALHARAVAAFGTRAPLFKQGEMGRIRLLERFRANGNAVLFATDSFWEGVSVSGRALRLVIIPRLPFKVPTEPVQQARYERLEAMGKDPFRAYALPQAVLRLRQGVGRLIRTTQDRGAVLVLDRRVRERWYGKVFLQSMPPFQRVTGPSRRVLEQLRAFFAQAQAGPLDSPHRPG